MIPPSSPGARPRFFGFTNTLGGIALQERWGQRPRPLAAKDTPWT